MTVRLSVTCGGDAPNCPFMDRDPWANFRKCTRMLDKYEDHTRLGPDDFPDRDDPPDWCPLRTEPVLVEVR